jgi:hypothetical protein
VHTTTVIGLWNGISVNQRPRNKCKASRVLRASWCRKERPHVYLKCHPQTINTETG